MNPTGKFDYRVKGNVVVIEKGTGMLLAVVHLPRDVMTGKYRIPRSPDMSDINLCVCDGKWVGLKEEFIELDIFYRDMPGYDTYKYFVEMTKQELKDLRMVLK